MFAGAPLQSAFPRSHVVALAPRQHTHTDTHIGAQGVSWIKNNGDEWRPLAERVITVLYTLPFYRVIALVVRLALFFGR